MIAIVVIFLGTYSIAEYKPKSEEIVLPEQESGASLESVPLNQKFTILTWNIGYGALGQNADFFMDGGKQVKTATKEQVLENVDNFKKVISSQNPDFVFLQEVDEDSGRSHGVNEKQLITSAFSDYASFFAYNFKVFFVPYPLPPIGKVKCGIQTLSRYKTDEGVRISLPCPFKAPVRYVNLKRCLMVNRFKIQTNDNQISNKELVMINAHLEAYDSGEGKIAQTKVLKQLIEEEYEKGNYVIVGGDFNQTFSNVDLSPYPYHGGDLWKAGFIDVGDYSNDFTFLMDTATPTCRSLDKTYTETASGNLRKDDFQFYMIDGFIVSNNIKVESLETLNQNFQNSDHNPVKLVVSLED